MDNTQSHVDLNEPVKRGDDEIAKIYFRRPKAGELRGVTVSDLVRMDVASVMTVIPRVSMPPLTSQEAENLDPFDLGECAAIIQGFFTDPPRKRETSKEVKLSPEISSMPPQTSPLPSAGDPVTSGTSTSMSSSSGGDKPGNS
tara:strand:- start:42837 stop:43265 length:429 start_codon:yes stop_codon:yes gene_type:complete